MTTEFEDRKKPFADIFRDLASTGFIAYCGAGISIPAPTCAPSWWVLTEEILTAFFQSIPDEWGLPKDIIIKEQMFQPEAMFEVFGNIVGKSFYETFKALDVSTPNANHKLIARLAKAGILKACFTTNFDIYIERALKEEGVSYELLVENEEYDKIYDSILKNGLPQKFLVCKIHGTIERPDTIIAVASAYKSLKGFSPPKSRLFEWFLERYSCLFLGYAGWDFEHANYRKFWDRSGPKLKNIFWNRRIGEKGGPKFPIIFNSCQQKFVFSEMDMPRDWIAAIKALNLSNLTEVGLTVVEKTEDAKFWEKAKQDRLAFFHQWVQTIPKVTALSVVIAEGMHFSARFKAMRDSTIQKARQGPQTSATAGPDPNLTAEMQQLGMKMGSGQISMADYQKRMQEIQIEMQLSSVKEDQRKIIKDLIASNKYPGVTDNPQLLQSLIAKVGPLSARFSGEEAMKIAVPLAQNEFAAMMKGGNAYMAEMMTNMWLVQNMDPADDGWKADFEKVKQFKAQFISGEIPDQAAFQKKLMEIMEKKQYRDMGMDVDIDKQIQILVQMMMSAKTREEFILGCEAFNTSLVGIYARINADLMKSPEFKAMETAVNAKPATQAVYNGDQNALNQKYAELGQLLTAGKIDATEYQKRATAIQMEALNKVSVGVSQEQPQDVPKAILDAYDAKIRGQYLPLYQKCHELFPEPNSYPKMLLDLVMLSLWIAATQMIYTEYSQQYYPIAYKGEYPLIKTHPSIKDYLYSQNMAWIQHGFATMDRRFGQTLCRFAVDLAEEADDFDLCLKATEKALEYEAGKMNEAIYMKIPVSLAAFYEKKGDKSNALKWYNVGLEALRTQFIPPFADMIAYRCALLTAETDKLTALKILILGFPEYLGNEPPMKFPARDKGLEMADQLAKELGFGTVKAAMQKLFDN